MLASVDIPSFVSEPEPKAQVQYCDHTYVRR